MATKHQRETLAELYRDYYPLIADSLERRGPFEDQDREDFSETVNYLRTTSYQPSDFASYTTYQAGKLIQDLNRSIAQLKEES